MSESLLLDVIGREAWFSNGARIALPSLVEATKQEHGSLEFKRTFSEKRLILPIRTTFQDALAAFEYLSRSEYGPVG